MKIKQIVALGANASVSLALGTHSLSLSFVRVLHYWCWLYVCVCVLCTIIEHNLCMYLCDAVARAIKRMFVACILLRHFSIYIYDIDVTRYYLNSYLSCSFSALGIPFSIDICVPRTHFDWVYRVLFFHPSRSLSIFREKKNENKNNFYAFFPCYKYHGHSHVYWWVYGGKMEKWFTLSVPINKSHAITTRDWFNFTICLWMKRENCAGKKPKSNFDLNSSYQ